MSGDSWIPLTTAVATAVLSGTVLLLLQLIVTPRIERNKTIQQELWKAKKDAFLNAVELIDRTLAVTVWEGAAVPKDYAPNFDQIPKSDEINTQLRLLLLLSNNPEISTMFLRPFTGGGTFSPSDRGRFISLLRTELFSTAARFDPDKVPFFFPQTPDQLRAAAEDVTKDG